MNMPLISRFTLLGLACSAALTLPFCAQAAFNGQLLVGSEVPDWAVGDEYGCEGTLITTSVVISNADCANHSGYFLRRTGQKYNAMTTVSYPDTRNVLGSVSVMLIDGPFGYGTETAPIASYLDEKKALVDGNDDLTQGTRMGFLTNDGLGMYSGTRASKQARKVNNYADWSSYTGHLNENEPVPDGPRLIYRSLQKYTQLEPQRQLASYFITPELTLTDIDDAVIFTAGSANWAPAIESPIAYEKGAGLYGRLTNGTSALIGMSWRGYANVRLSHYWPWVVQTMVNAGLWYDALELSQKVLGTSYLRGGNVHPQIGQIYTHYKPGRFQLEYFRVIGLQSNNELTPFPDRSDDPYWEYLGTTLPDIEQATTAFRTWSQGNTGVTQSAAGSTYATFNPATQTVEYFRQNKAGQYGAFPTDQTSNGDWTYLGTDLPTRKLKPLAM